MVDSSFGLATARMTSTFVSCWILDGSVPNSSRRPADAGDGWVVVVVRNASVEVEIVANTDRRDIPSLVEEAWS